MANTEQLRETLGINFLQNKLAALVVYSENLPFTLAAVTETLSSEIENDSVPLEGVLSPLLKTSSTTYESDDFIITIVSDAPDYVELKRKSDNLVLAVAIGSALNEFLAWNYAEDITGPTLTFTEEVLNTETGIIRITPAGVYINLTPEGETPNWSLITP